MAAATLLPSEWVRTRLRILPVQSDLAIQLFLLLQFTKLLHQPTRVSCSTRNQNILMPFVVIWNVEVKVCVFAHSSVIKSQRSMQRLSCQAADNTVAVSFVVCGQVYSLSCCCLHCSVYNDMAKKKCSDSTDKMCIEFTSVQPMTRHHFSGQPAY